MIVLPKILSIIQYETTKTKDAPKSPKRRHLSYTTTTKTTTIHWKKNNNNNFRKCGRWFFFYISRWRSTWWSNFIYSYQILNPGGIVGIDDAKKCGALILESTTLDPDMYRIGHTKAYLRSINRLWLMIDWSSYNLIWCILPLNLFLLLQVVSLPYFNLFLYLYPLNILRISHRTLIRK